MQLGKELSGNMIVPLWSLSQCFSRVTLTEADTHYPTAKKQLLHSPSILLKTNAQCWEELSYEAVVFNKVEQGQSVITVAVYFNVIC